MSIQYVKGVGRDWHTKSARVPRFRGFYPEAVERPSVQSSGTYLLDTACWHELSSKPRTSSCRNGVAEKGWARRTNRARCYTTRGGARSAQGLALLGTILVWTALALAISRRQTGMPVLVAGGAGIGLLVGTLGYFDTGATPSIILSVFALIGLMLFLAKAKLSKSSGPGTPPSPPPTPAA